VFVPHVPEFVPWQLVVAHVPGVKELACAKLAPLLYVPPRMLACI
jgi:hypothetical protein